MANKLGFQIKAEKHTHWLKLEHFDDGSIKDMTGSVAALIKGQAQLSGAEITIVPDLFSYMDWMFHYNTYGKFKTAKPKRASPHLNLLKPFSGPVWLTLVTTLLIVGALFAILMFYFHNEKDYVQVALTIIMYQLWQCKSMTLIEILTMKFILL